MDNLNAIKQMVEEVTLNEAKSLQVLRSLVSKQNEQLHNVILDKVIAILEKWSYTPPSEILKELDDIQNGKSEYILSHKTTE